MRTLKIIQFLILSSLPIILLILPINHFDNGQSLCLSQLILNKSCLGCGITRSVQHLIHFDFSGAYKLNKLVVIVFPVLSYFYFKYWLKKLNQIKAIKKSK